MAHSGFNFFYGCMHAMLIGLYIIAGMGITSQAAPVEKDRGKITTIIGEAILRSDKGERHTRIGSIVHRGDTLSTMAESRCEITFGNGRKVRLDENSILVFTSRYELTGDEGNADLQALGGSVWVNVMKLTHNTKFELSTPTVVAAIRGTTYNLDCFSGGTDIQVLSGTVAASPIRNGNDTAFMVERGNRFIAVTDLESFIAKEQKAFDDFSRTEQGVFEAFSEGQQAAFDEFTQLQSTAIKTFRNAFRQRGGLYIATTAIDSSRFFYRDWIRWNVEKDK